MLDEFPEPPTALPQKTNPPTNEKYLGELKAWGWAKKTHLRGATAFGVDWNVPIHSGEVLVTPATLDEFSKATNNVSVINRRTTKRNIGPLSTFFNDASVRSPILHSYQCSAPHTKAQVIKNKITLSKVKTAAKKSAKKLSCFSSDGQGENSKKQKDRTSTFSIVSSIAEITDMTRQTKWKLYFKGMDERRRAREASWACCDRI
jgi:hypothetical protein